MARYKVYEKGYKAFEKGMICRGKQYKENTIFEEPSAELCHTGMHFCKEPLDVLNYYPLIDDDGNFTEFAEVEALDKCVSENDKSCTKKLKIKSKIGFDSKIKGKKDNWIVLAEWVFDEDIEKYIPVCVKTAQIDGKVLKEDTFYKLENGKFVEVKE